MSENIEKAVQTEESSETKGTEATAPAATDNVVLYPVSDEEKTVSAAQETSDTESKATDGKTADNTNKFSDTQNTKESSPKDAEEEDDDDLEEDFYEQQEKSRSKDEHPFREFFSNFRSKRKIEMNRERCVLTFQILQTETETAFNMLEELVPRAGGDLLVEMDRHTVVFLKSMENVESFDELFQLGLFYICAQERGHFQRRDSPGKSFQL